MMIDTSEGDATRMAARTSSSRRAALSLKRLDIRRQPRLIKANAARERYRASIAEWLHRAAGRAPR